MRQVFLIAENHARTLFKDRTAVLIMLLLPLALSFVTGMAFGDISTESQRYGVPVAFVDGDGGLVAQSIIDAMSVYPYSPQSAGEDEARQLVRDREVAVAVFIPPGLEQSLQQELPIEITVLRSSYQESPRMVEQHLNGLLLRIRSAAAAANLARSASIDWSDAYAQAQSLWEPFPPVTVTSTTVALEPKTHIPTGYNLASPGYVVMFGMMMAISAGASIILAERDGGTLGRLLTSPLSQSQLLLGKALGIMITAVIQMSILIALGQMIFGVSWGSNLPGLVMLVITLSMAATGIGMFLASLCRTSSQASATGVLTVLVLSMLGGTWWPLEVMPSHMQTIARTIPSGWAMDGFTSIIMRGAGPGDVLVHALVMAAFGAVFLFAAIKIFRYSQG